MPLIRKKKEKKRLPFLPRLKIFMVFPSCGFCEDGDADQLQQRERASQVTGKGTLNNGILFINLLS